MEDQSSDLRFRGFKIKFFFDTNVLSFLIDNSQAKDHPLITSGFCERLSSAYVIFEFVGIRKREHYLRQLLAESEQLGAVNLTSLLKARDNFDKKKYVLHQVEIKKKVAEEINKIKDDFGIDYESNELHSKLLYPTTELCLISMLSREDSMVTISSTYPSADRTDEQVYILTHDKDYYSFFSDKNFKNSIDEMYEKSRLPKPEIIKLTNNENGDLLFTYGQLTQVSFIDLVRTILVKHHGYVGKIFRKDCGNSAADSRVICVDFEGDAKIHPDTYLTIIGKDLDFIIPIPEVINEYRKEGKQAVPFPITRHDASKLSFLVPHFPKDYKFKDKEDEPSLLEKIKAAGNLVFINPDSP